MDKLSYRHRFPSIVIQLDPGQFIDVRGTDKVRGWDAARNRDKVIIFD